EQFRKGGRLYYFGAGTSGRLGVLDASECPPTFGVKPDMVNGIIAGGDRAIRTAVEGAEDNFDFGREDAKVLGKDDVCVVISASGNPGYLLGVLDRAKERGTKTIAITCNPKGKILEEADNGICVVVGPEAITGSSRMKAGTAQKMVLNMLSTGAMVKTGKTYENLMIDVMPTNLKLRDRASRIVSEIADVDKEYARNVLENSDWKVKTAITMIKGGMDKDEANELLDNNDGVLRKALNTLA
nr:N-acetylmuramic acid 6-phosphate etherase [Cyanobacteria bacterium RUI128]